MKPLDKAQTISVMLVGMILWAYMSEFIRMLKDIDNWIFHDRYVIPYIFYSCICAPVFEELIFRHIPLQTAKLIYDPNSAKGLKLTVLVILMSSFIFGWGHGRGWDSVILQGFLGVGFCYVYLKNGYSYWSSVILHSLYNLFWLFTK